MDIIPLISSDSRLVVPIEQTVRTVRGEERQVLPLADAGQALEYLNIEMPELVIVNFSDPAIDAFAILDTIMGDPWLHHGGIVALCGSAKDMKRVDEVQGANIIASLSHDDISGQLQKVMGIIESNRRILFQREIGSDIISNISGSFKLDNDPLEARCYVNLICNFLFNFGRIDVDKKIQLNLALYEMLINAIEHGNCGITYDEKSAWLENGRYIDELILEKRRDPLVAQRRVTFEYTITPERSRFFIGDEGDGFDWKKMQETTAKQNLFELHGRGIMLTRKFTENLSYNGKGNEVSFDIGYEAEGATLMPGLFKEIKPVEAATGDIIFRQGEASDFLYFIAKGRYEVIVNGTVVSTLTADDLFMGEMSFLLNNRRSATVRAATRGSLIKVSKKEFVEALKRKPHYGLFLCRLLAQRIQRVNERSSKR